jgi:hypothetical protein
MVPANELEIGWTSPDRRAINSISGSGDALFFTTLLFDVSYEAYVWDPRRGAQKLIGFSTAAEGGACCVETNGADLVWLQGSGAYDASVETFETVDLMTAPFATSAAELEPRRLRTLEHDFLVGAWIVVGGGYALMMEQKQGMQFPVQHTLTRLSDGAYWVIPLRPQFVWGEPLYVDAEELALVLNAGPEVWLREGLQSGESYTIVRLSIDSLGPPITPRP